MSLQVSNQTTSGRRTPQVYPGFGAVPAGGTTTPTTATNGSGSGTASSGPNGAGSVGRTGKANSKQSHIPVAIGSVAGTPNNAETTAAAPAAPQTAVVHPGTAVTTDGTPGQKSIQSDHLYGMKQQGPATMIPATAAAAANRSTTNGTQSADKTKLSQQKNASGDGAATGGKKADPPTTAQQPAGETGSKLRAPANTRNAQQKQSSDEAAAKAAPEQPKAEKTADFESSLLTEKTLRGFMSDGEEMDSLLLEPWDLEDTQPLARANAGKSKTPKAAPQAQARVSPFKTGKPEQTNSSSSPTKKGPSGPAVVVEGDGEKNRSPKAAPKESTTAATTAPSTPVAGGNDSLIGRPLRSISGRRSTRPISDIKFMHTHRRSTAGGDQLNDSISSMNVTIGSEIGNDSLSMRTPGSATRKRKDMTPESTSDMPVAESPKRARLDFGGFLGMVGKVATTPVTMLKNRLSRVNLQSTPRALIVDEEDASKVVTAEATTTTANITPQKEGVGEDKPTEGTMEVDVAEKEEKSAEPGRQTVVPGKDGTEQQESSSAAVADEDEVEVKIVSTEQQQQQKQWCSIM